MDSIKPILEQFAEALKVDVKTVSKRFADSIESVVTESSIEINGSPYISVLIDGRRPTRPDAPKGNPTFQEIIYAWIQDKGIQPRADEQGNAVSQLSLSWIISQHIHKYGDRLYQAGGGNNIFDTIVNKSRISAFSDSIAGAFAVSIQSDILKEFK